MSKQLITQINNYSCFNFDVTNNKVINLKHPNEVDIDEFLNIQFILDKNNIYYKFERNFEIKIMN